ncbi:sodium:solute symporter family protein [Pseudohongiella spirulinae]|uniref:Na+/solute symporter n=1 Tax=Pseudohongiella spirulinae TaxID=1249552 RepID=A0A0S2KGH6_9GAMM|nr:sodium:solute symporter family protein [Pseudohongiella spirulinae]ALO47386.1 Na+/solute symporter [Pseudohongiella spirulinae]
MLLALVVVYLLVSIGIGVAASRKVHSTRDYITAGRSLPMFMVIAMVFATWFGAETVLGISATFLDEGFRGLISDPLGAALCLVLFGLIFALPLYRMQLLTLGDFFYYRYNKPTEMILSLCIMLSYLGWVSAQVTALGLVFNVLTDGMISMTAGMIIGAAVVMTYTLVGGMWSVAVTTCVQMVVIVIGLLLVTGSATNMAGGVGHVVATASAEGKFEWLPTLDLIDMLGWMAALFTLALGSIPQQDVFQRVNTSKNERVAVWGTTIGGLSYFFFAAIPLLLAYSASMIDPEMTARLMEDDTQLVLPTFVFGYMPFWLQVVFFGALLSVIMSTASGTLLAPSVTFTENILRNFLPDMSDKQLLLYTRLTVFVFTILVIINATASSGNIHHMVENAYRITLAGVFVPLTAGLFWRRASNFGCTLSIVLGLGSWLLLEFLYPDIPFEPQFVGLGFSLLGMIGGSLARPNPYRDNHRGLAQPRG